ncbi:MAG: GNAT family N-acetyltransferase [Verrucomicrobiales bacterium]|nr:GNAT family N-acetyltransferase [Verrucomicrobiales bacterium]
MAEDIPDIIRVNKKCFPLMAEENVVWTKGHLVSHLRLFPQGQFVVECEGKLIGGASSLIVTMGCDDYRTHTYAGITDGGFFYNHDPAGDTLYGADVYVDPDYQGCGIGAMIYEARRELCRNLNLRRIVAGGRLAGYSEYADKLTPEAYVHEVEMGAIRDQVLSFQLREGFVVRGVIRNYIIDPKSKNCASYLEWLNPDFRSLDETERKVRVACVQYQVRRINTFEEFADQVEYFVSTASEYRADFLVFPEFFSVQLLSMEHLRDLNSIDGIKKLTELEDDFMELMTSMAREYGVHIIAGSHPMRRDNVVYNVSPLISPDGSSTLQPKLHITPAEKSYWGITGGDELHVINTPKARVGILICYDSEFPEAARYLADQGAEIIFVPYCTDNRTAWMRVNACSQARAIENQVYVVTAGVIGNLPSVAAMDIHYARSAVFTPSDFEFARDGVQAQSDSNVEMLLVSDLDINDLYRNRSSGSVRPLRDRRLDLFHLGTSLKNDQSDLNETDMRPIDLVKEEE